MTVTVRVCVTDSDSGEEWVMKETLDKDSKYYFKINGRKVRRLWRFCNRTLAYDPDLKIYLGESSEEIVRELEK